MNFRKVILPIESRSSERIGTNRRVVEAALRAAAWLRDKRSQRYENGRYTSVLSPTLSTFPNSGKRIRAETFRPRQFL